MKSSLATTLEYNLAAEGFQVRLAQQRPARGSRRRRPIRCRT